MKPKAIVLDIDNTILDVDWIYEDIYNLELKGDDAYAYFYKHCNSDKVNFKKGLIDFLGGINSCAKLIFSTAREDICREETVKKLDIDPKALYMRKTGDKRLATEVKEEHLKEIMQKYDIIAFIDDDLHNCQMAKRLGIFAMRVT